MSYIQKFLALLLISTLSLSFNTLNDATEVVFFKGTWKQLFEKSASENKPVMVYMTATWCGYCQATEELVFKSDTAYNYLNENFICYKLDSKTKEAKQIRAEHPLEGYPCYYYYDSNGKLLRQTNTFMYAEGLKTDAEKVLKKYNKKK